MTLCIIGLDEPEYTTIKSRVSQRVLAHETLPKLRVEHGKLAVEAVSGAGFVPVSAVIYHGIFADDQDTLAGLALWDGPCLPSARAMMDCRLKLPCLVRALQFTRFKEPLRGFLSANATYYSEAREEYVAKWGNWHCGENKARFSESWSGSEAAIIEPYLQGTAVRVVLIGNTAWQIQLAGDDWLKSIHHPTAEFMDLDGDLLVDTRQVARGFGLDVMANDYIIGADGTPHLLEVNHIPNVTRFPEIWQAYVDYVVSWCQGR